MATTTMRIMMASALALLSTAAHGVRPIYTVQTGIGNEDFEGDSQNFYYLTGSALFSEGLSPNSIVDLLGEITTIEFSEEDELSGEEIFLQGTYSYTPRAGFRVPTYSLGLRYEEEFTDDDAFESDMTTLLASVSYRMNDRTAVLGGLKYSERKASDDSDIEGLFFNLDYRFTPRWLLYGTLSLEEEEVDLGASTASPRPLARGLDFVGGHHLPSEGGAVGAGAGGTGSGSIGEDFDNTIITLGASFKIDALNTLDFSVEHAEYESSAGTDTGDTYSIDFFHRF